MLKKARYSNNGGYRHLGSFKLCDNNPNNLQHLYHPSERLVLPIRHIFKTMLELGLSVNLIAPLVLPSQGNSKGQSNNTKRSEANQKSREALVVSGREFTVSSISDVHAPSSPGTLSRLTRRTATVP